MQAYGVPSGSNDCTNADGASGRPYRAGHPVHGGRAGYRGCGAASGRRGGSRRAACDIRTSCVGCGAGTICRPRAPRSLGVCAHRPRRPWPCRPWRSGRRPACGSGAAPTRPPGLARARHFGAPLALATRSAPHPGRGVGQRGRGIDRVVAHGRGRPRPGDGRARRRRRLGARRHGRLRDVRGNGPAFGLRRREARGPAVVYASSHAQPRHEAPARSAGSCSRGRVPDEPLARSVRRRAPAAASTVVRDPAARAPGDAGCEDGAVQCQVLRARGRAEARRGEGGAGAPVRPPRGPRPPSRDQQRPRPPRRRRRPSRRRRRAPGAPSSSGCSGPLRRGGVRCPVA